ncbi:MAG TPA: hypothetical protein VJA21_33380, partial [Verrucomicrobiae bacterium]
ATYRISDNNAVVTAGTLAEAAGICESWYDHVFEVLGIKKPPQMPPPNLSRASLDRLNASIRDWERRIVEAVGREYFQGHGNYRVGLNLTVAKI